MCTIMKQCRTAFIKMKTTSTKNISGETQFCNSPKLLTFRYPCDEVILWVHCSDVIQMFDCEALTIKVSGLRDFHSGVHNVMLPTGCQDFWASEPTRAENVSNMLNTL